jgi:glycosyltransferase involved in cell wall biosynthesis
MRLAILNITSGGMSGGYRKYLDAVLPRLVRHPKISALLIGAPSGVDDSSWRAQTPHATWCTLASPRRLVATAADGGIAELFVRFRPDAVFVPTARPFVDRHAPVVTMLRNMEPLAFPNAENPFPERVRTWVRRRAAWEAVHRADRIIAISGFVRDFLVERWGITPEKIGLVYHGVDPLPAMPVRPARMPTEWDDGFLFTAGSVRPARGLEDLLRAIPKLPPSVRIAVAGGVNASMGAYARQLARMVEASGARDRVAWLGSCTGAEMSWCYRRCTAFVMTSRVEACPNTALEAMTEGCVTIAADNPPLPEIFGTTVVYYHPRDGADFAVWIQEVLAWTSDYRVQASARARARAADFTWDRCVNGIVAECERAMVKHCATAAVTCGS